MTGTPLIQVDNLSRVFDVSRPWLERVTKLLPRQFLVAAANVSFSIDRRETFGLVGESGSGKSTIAHMIVGLIPPSGGTVVIDGMSMTDRTRPATLQKLRQRIQMVFQNPYASLDPRWRAFDIIAEPIRAFHLCDGKAATEARVNELLRLVGLDPVDGRKYPHEFSGGQRQRIAIARALASQPEFIVCDEPTSALDVSVQAQILNLMCDLQRRLGLTYLLISHNLAVVAHMADELGVMYLGRLIEQGDARQIIEAPLHPYTRLLLHTVPDPESGTRHRTPLAGEVPSPLDPPPGCGFHPRCPLANARCKAERPAPHKVAKVWVACHAVEEGRLSASPAT